MVLYLVIFLMSLLHCKEFYPCIIYSNMILTNSVYWKAMEYKFTLKIIVSCSSLNS